MHTLKSVSLCLILLILSIPFAFSIQLAEASDETFDLIYDANGNLIQDQRYSYEYNELNQLVSIKDSNSSETIAEYFYDHSGERIKKIEHRGDGDETTYYVDENFIRVVNSSGTFDIVYYLQDGQIIAREENSQKFYYHPDHLGSTTIVTDSSGNVVEKTEYAPFGAVLEGGSDRFLFTGQEADQESGLMYYGARYYSPFLARFTQPDTVIQDIYDPQALNRYAYARNNPLKYTDPSGHYVHVIIGAAIGAFFGAGFSIWSQMRNGASWKTLNWKKIGIAAAIGAGAGALGAATFGAMGGLSASLSTKAGFARALMAGGGGASSFGAADRLGTGLASGKSFKSSLGSALSPASLARDFAIGAALVGVGAGIAKGIGAMKAMSQPLLKGPLPQNPNAITKQLGVQPEITGNQIKWKSEEMVVRYHQGHSQVGEYDVYEQSPHYAMEYFNPVSNKWERLTNPKTGRYNFLPGEEFP
jgi:RHS repeat-associated protein